MTVTGASGAPRLEKKEKEPPQALRPGYGICPDDEVCDRGRTWGYAVSAKKDGRIITRRIRWEEEIRQTNVGALDQPAVAETKRGVGI